MHQMCREGFDLNGKFATGAPEEEGLACERHRTPPIDYSKYGADSGKDQRLKGEKMKLKGVNNIKTRKNIVTLQGVLCPACHSTGINPTTRLMCSVCDGTLYTSGSDRTVHKDTG